MASFSAHSPQPVRQYSPNALKPIPTRYQALPITLHLLSIRPSVRLRSGPCHIIHRGRSANQPPQPPPPPPPKASSSAAHSPTAHTAEDPIRFPRRHYHPRPSHPCFPLCIILSLHSTFSLLPLNLGSCHDACSSASIRPRLPSLSLRLRTPDNNQLFAPALARTSNLAVTIHPASSTAPRLPSEELRVTIGISPFRSASSLDNLTLAIRYTHALRPQNRLDRYPHTATSSQQILAPLLRPTAYSSRLVVYLTFSLSGLVLWKNLE